MINKRQYKTCILVFDCIIIAILTATLIIASFKTSFSYAFKFFTVLSNLFCGVTSYISFIAILAKDKLPKWVQVIEYTSAVTVFITFAVVLFVLGPYSNFNSVYTGANLILHLIVPIIVLAKFVLLINVHDMSINHTFLPFSLMGVYALCYMFNVFIHNGFGNSTYDFYGFASKGPLSSGSVFSILLAFGYILAFILYLTQKKMHKLLYK